MEKNNSEVKTKRFVTGMRWIQNVFMSLSLLFFTLVYGYHIRRYYISRYSYMYFIELVMRREWEIEMAAFFMFTAACLIRLVICVSGKERKTRMKKLIYIPVYIIGTALVRWTLLFLKMSVQFSLMQPSISFWHIVRSDILYRQGDTIMSFPCFVVLSLIIGSVIVIVLAGYLPDLSIYSKKINVRQIIHRSVCFVRRVILLPLCMLDRVVDSLIDFIRIKDDEQKSEEDVRGK